MSQSTSPPPTGSNDSRACPFGHPECNGISGLLMGELSCFRCFQLASEQARDVVRGAV